MQIDLQNIGRRVVSFRCNSGASLHMPPGVSVKVADWEVEGNAMVAKLISRGLISKPSGKAAGVAKKETFASAKPADKKASSTRKKG
jgi:hypothetical protein